MAYIYKITNKLNNKAYVGKTMLTIQERWKQHLRDAKRSKIENRPLYKALNKYGPENFTIEQIEECSDKVVNEREQYWIQYYDTYSNGYNATLGGDGKQYINYDKIVETYCKNDLTAKEVAEICNCCVDTVLAVLKQRNIPIKDFNYWNQKRKAKAIIQYDKNGNILNSFPSIRQAANYLKEYNYTTAKDIRGIVCNIGRVADGKRQSYLGFIWKYQ